MAGFKRSESRIRAALLAAGMFALLTVTASDASETSQVTGVIGKSAKMLPAGLWQVTLADGSVHTTHGPDPLGDHGPSIGIGDPERVPFCSTSYAQHVLYARRSSTPTSYNSSRLQIQGSMRRINAVLSESAMDSGGIEMDYRVICDGGTSGAISVGQFVTSGNDYETIVNAARAAGFDREDLNYSIFFDGNYSGVCGIGSYFQDERLTTSNWNNQGGGYAITYRDCWDSRTPMHENGHNMGAVQPSAPHSTGSGGHCNDVEDVMCYAPDGGNRNQTETLRCSDKMHFDCGHDTYFDAAVEAGEWLASHWNLGSILNRFVVFGEDPPPPPPNQPPVADFGWACYLWSCEFTDQTADEFLEAATYQWSFGDGTTSTYPSPQHNYPNAGPSEYQVTLTVRDWEGLTGTVTKTIPIFYEDTDPATPTLTNSQVRFDKVGSDGTWDYFKVGIPAGMRTLQIDLQGPPCARLGICSRTLDDLCVAACGSQLDLYVRLGTKPTTSQWGCRAITDRNNEICILNQPTPGWWYIGVYAYKGIPNQSYWIRGIWSS